jgi:hypothetical protein
MSRGHGRVERLILEALKNGRGNANKGMFAMGTNAQSEGDDSAPACAL